MFVTGSYPPDKCGVGDYTLQLADALAGLQGTQVSVLTSCGYSSLKHDKAVVVRRSLPNWSLRSLLILIGEFRREQPDIVHVQYPTQGYGSAGLPWLVPFLAWLSGGRVVQTWHEGFRRSDFLKFLSMALIPGRTVVVRKVWSRQFRFPFDLIARRRQPIFINSASTLPRSHLDAEGVQKLRLRYAAEGRRLIVFFGFIHPLKRIELLFQIADPFTDHLIVIGNPGENSEYAARLEALAQDTKWRGHANIVGFIERDEAADILKAADALVLPLKAGGGEWNTAILAGIEQGTFVLTTSTSVTGYDPETNTYYAPVDGLSDMQQALKIYSGRKRLGAAQKGDVFDWSAIAARPLQLYQTLEGHRAALHLPSEKDPT